MKQPGYWFKTNLVYGLVVIVPLAVLVLLIAKAVEILQTVALSLKLESSVSAGFAILIALLLLLLVCRGIGTMVRTKIGTWAFEKLEQAVLQRVPGYELLGNILKIPVQARAGRQIQSKALFSRQPTTQEPPA